MNKSLIRIELWIISCRVLYWKFISGFFCLHFTKATVATKRKLSTKSIKEKYAALKEVEEGSPKPQGNYKIWYSKKYLVSLHQRNEKIFEAMNKEDVRDKSKH